jgi:hypothetical protein
MQPLLLFAAHAVILATVARAGELVGKRLSSGVGDRDVKFADTVIRLAQLQ